ncbi:MAG TPA: polymer-forming cytoskeletal protein [Bryobacteraceae bacterium]|nr:polymer-forming cytoskeletal protein [Bryobacteraceae bacterium]
MSQPTQQSYSGGFPVVIGKGMVIKGSVHSGEDMFLDGEIEGDLDVENCRLTVGPHGKLTANAKAREVDIQGIITGNVDSLGTTFIRHSGQLLGDVRTGGIVVEIGAVLRGRVEIVPRSELSGEVGKRE